MFSSHIVLHLHMQSHRLVTKLKQELKWKGMQSDKYVNNNDYPLVIKHGNGKYPI